MNSENGIEAGQTYLVRGRCWDADGDGVLLCDGDCDDTDHTIYPGAPELCDGVDNDCDGQVPESEQDGDTDGWMACEECNDDDANVNPDAAEACNGIDDDCSGSLDHDEVDADADGFMPCDGDCDDGLDTVNPDACEICGDTHDNDCDGLTDYQDPDCTSTDPEPFLPTTGCECQVGTHSNGPREWLLAATALILTCRRRRATRPSPG